MIQSTSSHGHLMATELEQSSAVFTAAATQAVPAALHQVITSHTQAIYTIARGSSDAAANVLAYEFMRELGIPVTSLPPSVFSVGAGVRMAQAAGLIISQSGGSDDLVRATQGLNQHGAKTLAITNVAGSPVETQAHVTLPIGAGPEQAVPATKTVIGAIAAGLAILAALKPDYAQRVSDAAALFHQVGHLPAEQHVAMRAALLRARHVYVIGRDTGFGAAQEVALKIKETCAIHAESYSASEVLHGPLQLATNALTVLVLDTGAPHTRDSIDTAIARFTSVGAEVIHVTPHVDTLPPAAAAAALLRHIYPVILDVALALGHNPDMPATLSKVTVTR